MYIICHLSFLIYTVYEYSVSIFTTSTSSLDAGVLGIPAELALDQEVHRARVVPVVLQHELLPWQGEEVRKGMPQRRQKTSTC